MQFCNMNAAADIQTPQIRLYPSVNRGGADHGWLKTAHSFSFGGYQNPKRIHFGALRVLNDDIVAPGAGFGLHPHDNMEIVTIPLRGSLQHRDSMGNTAVVQRGEVQVMSAGTGIFHSEMNPDLQNDVAFLQIWIFPDKQNVVPRYQQAAFNLSDRMNQFVQIVSPNPGDNGLWIHQQAWLSLGLFEAGHACTYSLHNASNGLFLFLIDGALLANGYTLHSKDALEVEGNPLLNLRFTSNCHLLVIEVPMKIQ